MVVEHLPTDEYLLEQNPSRGEDKDELVLEVRLVHTVHLEGEFRQVLEVRPKE